MLLHDVSAADPVGKWYKFANVHNPNLNIQEGLVEGISMPIYDDDPFDITILILSWTCTPIGLSGGQASSGPVDLVPRLTPGDVAAMSSGQMFFVHDFVYGEPSAEAGNCNVVRSSAIDPVVPHARLVVKDSVSFRLLLLRFRSHESALAG